MSQNLTLFLVKLCAFAVLIAAAYMEYLTSERRIQTIETQKQTIELLRKKDHTL